MFPRTIQAPCRLTARRHLALGGLAVTSALIAGAFVSTPAFADAPTSISSFGDLHTALADGDTNLQLTADLDSSTDPDVVNQFDAETVSSSTNLDLNGFTLSVNQITVGDGADLTVTDTTATADQPSNGALDVSASSGNGADTAVLLGDQGTFHVGDGAKVYAWGVDSGAGIGSDDSAGTARFVADGTASVTAYGGTEYDQNSDIIGGGAAIGGADGQSGITVVLGDEADVFARGGAGSAAVGGGAGGIGGDVHLMGDAHLDAQQGDTFGTPTTPASFVGAGQDAGDVLGSLRIDSGAFLGAQSDSPLRLSASSTVENAGTLALVQPDGYSNVAVAGTGTIHNLGSITAQTEDADGNGTSVDPSTLMDGTVQVTGDNFQVSIDANGGAYQGVASGHVLSGSLSDLIGDAYSDSGWSIAEPAGYTFTSWNTAADGSGANVVNDLTAAGQSTGTPKAVTLFAKYARLPYATATSLPSGTVGTPYSAQLPVAGDGLSQYFVSGGNSSNDVIPGLPAGLSIDASTGLVSGTPTEAINRDVTFYVQGTGGADLTYHLTIVPAAVVVTPPAPAAPQAPVMRTIPTRTVKLGHVLTIPLEATGGQPVSYAVTSGSLPKGITLNGDTGRISGTAAQSGTFDVVVTAKNSAGSSSIPIVIVVPEVQDLISTTNAVPAVKVGAAAVPLKVAGLKKGEHWTVKVDGKVVQRGTMKKAGTLAVSVHLKKALRDKVHTVTIAGSRKVTDPSTRAATTVTVTSLAARKTLKVSSKSVKGVKQIVVTKLAAGEHVVIKDGTKVIASGHATSSGTFAFPQSKAGKGTSKVTVHGAAAKRVGKLTVKNPKA